MEAKEESSILHYISIIQFHLYRSSTHVHVTGQEGTTHSRNRFAVLLA
jgi:hypothetical protein